MQNNYSFTAFIFTGGDDYFSFGSSFIFEDQSGPGTSFCFEINIFDDEDIEKDEVIVVVASILAPRGEFISSGGNIVVTTITILDNEG